MMAIKVSAPWHKESFDRFLQDGLPGLLARRLPLAGYTAEPIDRCTCRVTVVLAGASGDIEVVYAGISRPDEEGMFEIDGTRRTVVPTASSEDLDVADIRCVGEQLYDFVEARLGEAPEHLPWDEALARTWLPLDEWIRSFLGESHLLDPTNWLAGRTHLRRLVVPDRERVTAPGQKGRTCPIETPEGPNIGRVLSVALGAEIRDRKLVIVDERPQAGLGLAASLIPFLEHSDAGRLLMGANMMRQWLTPPDPEPALVQTGNEPDVPDFWCGRNLLTAFLPWGADSFEDALIISESCARRLNYPHPVEPGDKMSNRHGSKGVVSRILPDDEMPHLPDGTPVELVYNLMGLISRLNFGLLREAVMGRVARAEGAPAVVPPFQAPGERELRERLGRAGLRDDGMQTLKLGRGGKELRHPTTAGWVYWGRLVHIAREKIQACTIPGRCQRWEEPGYYALRDAGAFENLREHINTRAAERDDAGSVAARVAEGCFERSHPPAPPFAELTRRLAVAGVRLRCEEEKLTFEFATPGGDSLALAAPVPHPWLPERLLTQIGGEAEVPGRDALTQANARLERLRASQAPTSLLQKATSDLERSVAAFFEALLAPEHLRPRAHVLFTGRAVIAPGADLRPDQVGLPQEMAWTLFGPLVTREVGDEAGVRARGERVTQALDQIMARSWVIVYRTVDLGPLPFLAFRPVRCTGNVIRVHPLACTPFDVDFDGDQIAVSLPITDAAQREAGERLTLAAHLRRDPSLLEQMLPRHDALLGLAELSLTEGGRKEIAGLAGGEIPGKLFDGSALRQVARGVLAREDVGRTIDILHRLMHRGFEAARASGASFSPFFGAGIPRPPEPRTDDPDAWAAYAEELSQRIASFTDWGDNDQGLRLAIESGARGGLRQLLMFLGAHIVPDYEARPVPVRHGYVDGLTPGELRLHAASAWNGIFQAQQQWEQITRELRGRNEPKALNVLARAMRAKRPGVVFARAAAIGEEDPLTDVDSRLFVGLPAKDHAC